MPTFNGQLRANEIFSAMFNMIISQEVFADNLEGLDTGFVGKFRVDGTLYGDTKLYYAADVLKSQKWVQDGNDKDGDSFTNVLKLHRPPAPEVQAITISNFRQIALTTDQYLSKRFWMTEGSFSQFNSIMLDMIRETKNIFDYTLISTFLGTDPSSANQQVGVAISTITETGLDKDKKEAMIIAQTMADLLVDMKRPSRKYNDYGFMRSFNASSLRFVWNSKWINKIRKIDLPTIFHKDGIMEKMDEDIMPKEYFGTALSDTTLANYSATTPAAGKPINSSTGAYTPGVNNANGTVRSLIETEITVSSVNYHLFPGDELPVGATIGTSAAGKQFKAAEVYVQDDSIICKIIHRRSLPFMSAFEVGTSFYNARNLSTNNYLTWGFSDLEHLINYPWITVKAN